MEKGKQRDIGSGSISERWAQKQSRQDRTNAPTTPHSVPWLEVSWHPVFAWNPTEAAKRDPVKEARRLEAKRRKESKGIFGVDPSQNGRHKNKVDKTGLTPLPPPTQSHG